MVVDTYRFMSGEESWGSLTDFEQGETKVRFSNDSTPNRKLMTARIIMEMTRDEADSPDNGPGIAKFVLVCTLDREYGEDYFDLEYLGRNVSPVVDASESPFEESIEELAQAVADEVDGELTEDGRINRFRFYFKMYNRYLEKGERDNARIVREKEGR